MFERAFNFDGFGGRIREGLEEESDESDESSSSDDDEESRPMSVHDIRRQMRPATANSAASGQRQSPEQSTALPRHTVF